MSASMPFPERAGQASAQNRQQTSVWRRTGGSVQPLVPCADRHCHQPHEQPFLTGGQGFAPAPFDMEYSVIQSVNRHVPMPLSGDVPPGGKSHQWAWMQNQESKSARRGQTLILDLGLIPRNQPDSMHFKGMRKAVPGRTWRFRFSDRPGHSPGPRHARCAFRCPDSRWPW